MTVGELVLKLLNFKPNEEIIFYEEETNETSSILEITCIADDNPPYIFFKKEKN